MGIPDILKLIGLLIAASPAILGILIKNKDEGTGKPGKWILSCAIIGLGISIITQVFESYGALESASNQLRRHEQILHGLTRFNRLSIICDFDSKVPDASLLEPQSLTLNIVFQRSNLSELVIEAVATKHILSSEMSSMLLDNSEVGYVSVQGSVQYARTPLLENDTAFSSEVFDGLSSGKSFWVRFWTKDIARRLSQDAGFVYWPYESLGDFKDVGVVVTAKGTGANLIKSIILRFNENLIVTVPVECSVKGWHVEDVFSSLQPIIRVASANPALHLGVPQAARR